MSVAPRILIVDDERVNRQLLEVMLAHDGYRTTSAATGEEALEQVGFDPPDLILLDVMMPGMDGCQLVTLLKESEATRAIPIIMITALEERDARMMGLTAGAEDFLTKPVDRGELGRRVGNLLRRDQRGPASAADEFVPPARTPMPADYDDVIGRFAIAVATDFDEVLATVLRASERLSGDLDTDTRNAELVALRAATERGAELTRQLRSLARRDEVRPELVDLTALVRDIEPTLRSLVGEHVAVTAVQAPALGKILVDPRQVEQALRNLAVRARDAMPRGGKLRIETEEVFLDQEYVAQHLGAELGPHVLLTVTDSGEFEPEPELPPMAPASTTGDGLALAAVFGVVRDGGGTIEVTAQAGHGTTFKAYFPTAPVAGRVPTPTAQRG